MAENATLRVRLAKLEDRLANRPSGNGGELPESETAERKRIQDGRITDANPFLRDLLGYSHDELLGRKLWEIGRGYLGESDPSHERRCEPE